MADAIIISDLHLGSEPCRAKPLLQFLTRILEGELLTRELILNGDVFDSHDFRRLKKSHWKILSLLRKLSKRIEVTWIEGNHDGPADSISHLLGVEVEEQKIIASGGRRFLILHGHTFDKFITDHHFMTWFGDVAYALIQRIDPSYRLAKRAKHASKTFLRVQEKIKHDAIRYAQRLGCDAVCCGHTHQHAALAGAPGYYNSGCWTEPLGHYLTIADGTIDLHAFDGGFDADDQEQFELADDRDDVDGRARDVFIAHGLGYGQVHL